jgi:uncharacterized membrane protein
MLWHRHFGLLLLAGTGPAVLLAFPWIMQNWPTLGAWIALFFSQLCHQNPTRSFVLGGTTLPVCARCLALYLGGCVGIAAYPVLRFRWRQFQVIALSLIVSLCLIGLDVGLDMAGLRNNTFFSRSLTGALFGGACGLLLSLAIQHASSDCTAEQPTSVRHSSIGPSK